MSCIYVVFRTNDEIFNTTLRDIVSAHPVGKELQGGRMEEYRQKVLETFFKYGRREKLPAQRKKRLIILEQFALRFDSGRRYGEQDGPAIQPQNCHGLRRMQTARKAGKKNPNALK